MIGKLKGIVDTIYSDYLILDVMGIGFEVLLSSKDLASIDPASKALALNIHTQIRENDISLFGFINEIDKKMFLQLIKTKGVGGKLALTILGQSSISDLVSAITTKDKSFFKQISGVGPKLAERLISELQDEKFDYISFGGQSLSQAPISRENQILSDALSALVNLGYNKNESLIIITNLVNEDKNISLSEAIRLALRELAR